jgi:zinc protease
MRRLLATFVSVVVLIPQVWAADLVKHPKELQFPALSFDPPPPDSLRKVLANGVPAYIMQDREFPLVTIRVLFRGGQYVEPPEKAGLTQLASRVWRTGGAGALGPQQLDEELDFLAAQLNTAIAGTNGSVTLNLLAKDLNRGLELLMDVMLRPRFDEARLAKAKEDLLASMKERNDDTAGIENREWNRLLYGDDYWLNRLPVKRSVDGISRADLVAFHSRLLHPKDIVVAVAGDFETTDMLALLNETIGSISNRGEFMPEVPQPTHKAQSGVYLVHKPDVNQGRVSIGHLGVTRPFKEEFDLTVAADILGGGGFTAWMMQRVRSDEGLAYSAYANYEINNTYAGVFRAFFQSKSATCARAVQLTLELIERLRTQPVGTEELETSKQSFIQTFPNRFQSAVQTVSLYAGNELVGWPNEYWTQYRRNIESVNLNGVTQAASTYLHPDEFVTVVVGNVDEILQGHPDHPNAKFESFGTLHRLPLRDPMTLEPLAE